MDDCFIVVAVRLLVMQYEYDLYCCCLSNVHHCKTVHSIAYKLNTIFNLYQHNHKILTCQDMKPDTKNKVMRAECMQSKPLTNASFYIGKHLGTKITVKILFDAPIFLRIGEILCHIHSP